MKCTNLHKIESENNAEIMQNTHNNKKETKTIALVENGDKIIIDLPKRKINLLVSETVLEVRRSKLKTFEPKIKKGWLGRYSALVTNASQGGVLRIPTSEPTKETIKS